HGCDAGAASVTSTGGRGGCGFLLGQRRGMVLVEVGECLLGRLPLGVALGGPLTGAVDLSTHEDVAQKRLLVLRAGALGLEVGFAQSELVETLDQDAFGMGHWFLRRSRRTPELSSRVCRLRW